ncbi:MAG: signal peptidase I [Cellulomonadaceae bacterium]|jgi:signal peptidase I|nr:signal peptidase I [Cellulomonadaceae bacterium]
MSAVLESPALVRSEVALNPTATGAVAPEESRGSWKRTAKLLVLVISVALIASTVFKAFIAESFYVPSGSMKHTFEISDRFVVTRFNEDSVTRGDIVVFYDALGWTANSDYELGLRRNPWVRALKMAGIIPSSNNDIMVKRVIGVPGDHIVCCNAYQQLILNGHGVNEEVFLPVGMAPSQIKFDVTVPENSLFIMGDNRANSLDSRYFINHPVGPFISKDNVVGIAAATFWPLDHARILRNPNEPQLEAAGQ